MYNHGAEENCVICPAISGQEGEATWIRQQDIVYRDETVVALVNSKFIKGNEGHVIVVPVQHVEHVYDLDDQTAAHIARCTTLIARTMRAVYECDGVTIMQFNEPAGGQHAFHYHAHVIPRYEEDRFAQYAFSGARVPDADRVPYAQLLREKLTQST